MGSAREALAEDEEAPTARGMLTDDGQTITKQQQKDSVALAFGGATGAEMGFVKQFQEKHGNKLSPEEIVKQMRSNPEDYKAIFGVDPPK